MSDNSASNNYKELTFPSLLKEYDKIIIPMIQRDYAQGRTDKKAQEVRANLLNDIFDEDKKSIHFDLIFGSCEKRHENGKEKQCFIPVDGQQRLTTLFLLYLYAQKTEQHIEGVDLSKFSYDTRRAAADFCEKVTSEEWTIVQKRKVSDVIKDSGWFMNYWENDPTVAGMLNMLDAIHEKAEESKAKERSFPNLERIQFYFFDLEASGLNENLYLKMNSRGKPLTAFENLKASIEKVLPDNLESDDTNNCFPDNSAAPESFKDKWKFFMDRDWINIFWDSEHPESTDRNITAFLVRFLSGYKAYSEDDTISEDLKGINSEENYADFIPFECIKPILCLDGVFAKLARAFTTIGDVAKIKPSWDETITQANLSEYKIIAVVFTYVLFDGDKDVMRFAWNMAENTITGYDTFLAYCKRVAEILKYRNNEKHANKDFYEVLSSIKFDNPSAQLIEEVAKAKQILHGKPRSDGKSWEQIIIKAENYAFFKGAIRFLFQDETGKEEWDYFDKKWENTKKYFNNKSLTSTSLERSKLLRTFIGYFDSWDCFKEIYFDNEQGHWKTNLINKKLAKPIHELLNSGEFCDFDSYSSSLRGKEKELQEQLVKTELVVMLSRSGYYMEDGRNLHIYYANRGSDIYLGRNRKLLLDPSIQCENSIVCDDIFYGNNIDFKYRDYFFRWYGNPNERELDVYLMKDNWTEYKKRPNPTYDKGTDEDTHYCFRVEDGMTPEQFLNKLDDLINEQKNSASE